MTQSVIDFTPITMQVAFATAFVLATILISHFLGPKHKSARKSYIFECGLDSIGDARTPFSIRYFLVAILFVLFDIEIIFMYPWAVGFKEMSWLGLIKMLGFLFILLVGYVYVLKREAFDWDK